VVNSTVWNFGSVAWESRNLALTRSLTKKKQFYKHNSSSYYHWTYDGSFERFQREDYFQFRAHEHLGLWPTPNQAKVPKFKHTAHLLGTWYLVLGTWYLVLGTWYSFDQEFYADVEKPMYPNLEPFSSMGSMAMIRPKSQRFH
jgi:hypothetical protein